MSSSPPESPQAPDDHHPIMPPFVLLGHLVAQGVLHLTVSGPQLFSGAANALGLVFIVSGIAMVLSIASAFSREHTTILPLQVSDQLVTGGLFEYSRNPIYLGMTTILLGFALFLGSATPMLIVPIFPWWIGRNIIVHEERMLEERFGDAYRNYKQRVRRWI
ncbi:MAG: isoprenylcysteine carboxylmethyltransferase family protein [Myxococcota bacterium]|nr:isoprenylcysteine carboxylmethyltransferase family protein [Myxococcota bacterium]